MIPYVPRVSRQGFGSPRPHTAPQFTPQQQEMMSQDALIQDGKDMIDDLEDLTFLTINQSPETMGIPPTKNSKLEDALRQVGMPHPGTMAITDRHTVDTGGPSTTTIPVRINNLTATAEGTIAINTAMTTPTQQSAQFADSIFTDLEQQDMALNIYRTMGLMMTAVETHDPALAVTQLMIDARAMLQQKITPVERRIQDTHRAHADQPQIRFTYPLWSFRSMKSYWEENQNYHPDHKPMKGMNSLLDMRPDAPYTPRLEEQIWVAGIKGYLERRDENNQVQAAIEPRAEVPHLEARGPYPPIVSGNPLERTTGNDHSGEKDCLVYRDKNNPKTLDIVGSIIQFQRFANDSGYMEHHALHFLEMLMRTVDESAWEPFCHIEDPNIVAETIINIYWMPPKLDQSAKIQEFTRIKGENIYMTYARLVLLLQTHFHWMPQELIQPKSLKEAAKAIIHLVHPGIRVRIGHRRSLARLRREHPMDKIDWDLHFIQLTEDSDKCYRQHIDLKMDTKIDGVFVNFSSIHSLLIQAFNTSIGTKRKLPEDPPSVINPSRSSRQSPEPDNKKVRTTANTSASDTRDHLTPYPSPPPNDRRRQSSGKATPDRRRSASPYQRDRTDRGRAREREVRNNRRIKSLPRGSSISRLAGSRSTSGTRRWASPAATREFEHTKSGNTRTFKEGDKQFGGKIRTRYRSNDDNKYRKQSPDYPRARRDLEETFSFMRNRAKSASPTPAQVPLPVTPTPTPEYFKTTKTDIPPPRPNRQTYHGFPNPPLSPPRTRSATAERSRSSAPRSISRSNSPGYSSQMQKILNMLDEKNYQYWKSKNCNICSLAGHGSAICPTQRCTKCQNYGQHPNDYVCKLVGLKIARSLQVVRVDRAERARLQQQSADSPQINFSQIDQAELIKHLYPPQPAQAAHPIPKPALPTPQPAPPESQITELVSEMGKMLATLKN